MRNFRRWSKSDYPNKEFGLYWSNFQNSQTKTFIIISKFYWYTANAKPFTWIIWKPLTLICGVEISNLLKNGSWAISFDVSRRKWYHCMHAMKHWQCTMSSAVQVSSKISRASQLHVSSSGSFVMRTFMTSHIKVDNRVKVPNGLTSGISQLVSIITYG